MFSEITSVGMGNLTGRASFLEEGTAWSRGSEVGLEAEGVEGTTPLPLPPALRSPLHASAWLLPPSHGRNTSEKGKKIWTKNKGMGQASSPGYVILGHLWASVSPPIKWDC
jgi:hypothetical protein